LVVGYILLIAAATITKSGSVLVGSSAGVAEGVFGMPLALTLLSLGSHLGSH
jgi:hypothetical protein